MSQRTVVFFVVSCNVQLYVGILQNTIQMPNTKENTSTIIRTALYQFLEQYRYAICILLKFLDGVFFQLFTMHGFRRQWRLLISSPRGRF